MGGSDGSVGMGGSGGSLGTGTGGTSVGGTGGLGGAAGAAGDEGLAGQAGSGSTYDPACDEIESDATITAHLRITADNECEVFVNGSSVGTTSNWGAAVTIDVSLFLYPGKLNVVAVEGTNTSSQGGNDRGIIGALTVDGESGPEELVVTNASWLVSDTEQTGWTSLEFDDSDWALATEVANDGDSPWGAVLGSSTAKWIWWTPIPVAVEDKPNLETTYARKSFFFSVDGKTLSDDASCPE